MTPIPRLALALVLLPGALAAQSVFLAELNGGQESSPNGSPGTGTGRVLLDPSTSMIEIELSVSGLLGPITGAHIHTGPVGVGGGIFIALVGSGPTWSQTAGPLTPAQITTLRSSGYYFNVHSTVFLGGELRGQITPSHDRFDAYALGSKETPATGSPGVGIGEFILLPSGALAYSVTSSGLLGSVVGGHLHEGLPGVSGGIAFPLIQSSPSTFSGTTAVLTSVERAKLRAGRYYLNVHTSTFLGGEVRGQVVPSFTPYGDGCPGTPGIPLLDGKGTPVPGGAFSIDVTGGLPGGAGSLMLAADGADIPVFGVCSFLLNPVPLVLAAPIGLDGSGSFTLPVVLAPSIPIGWLAFQFAGFDGGSASGLSLSNGLAVSLNGEYGVMLHADTFSPGQVPAARRCQTQ